MQWPLLALLVLVVAILFWRGFIRDRKEYRRFRRLRATAARQTTYRKWLIEAATIFGGLSVVILIAVWPLLSATLEGARSWTPLSGLVERMSSGLGIAIWVGLGVAFLVGLLLPAFLLRGQIDEIPALGDVGALLPRNRAEVKWGALLSINAGLMEELLFRLALPALVFGVIGSAPLAFLLVAVFFGLLHAYQGRVGAITAAVLGLVFTLVYILSGSIVVPIVVHMLFDLRSLVLIPIVAGGVWAKVGGTSAAGTPGAVPPGVIPPEAPPPGVPSSGEH